MFRKMRRNKQVLSTEDCLAVLERGTSGVLAVLGDNSYPYAVPLSYVYHDSKLFFHSAKSGHKLDALSRESKCSFCVIDLDQIVPEEYTAIFRSVIVFGTARILSDDAEKRAALELLALRYSPDEIEADRQAAIEKDFPYVAMIELSVDHMSGKEAIELVRARAES